MKKVFSSHREVCHVWASRSQSEGTAGNISFIDDSIYSYHWWEMARFYETKSGKKYLFMRDWSYSSSTSKHMSCLRAAIPPGWEMIYVPGGKRRYGYYGHSGGCLLDHESNLRILTERMVDTFINLKSGQHPDGKYNTNHITYLKIIKYCRIFKLKVPDKAKKHRLIWDDIQHYVAGVVEKREQRRADRDYKDNREYIARRVHMRNLRKKYKNNLDQLLIDWRKGEINSLDFYVGNERITVDGYHMRIQGNEVQTNGHARVPVVDAKRLWKLIKAGKDIKGIKVGMYTVISMNGTLQIGCHKFTQKEIKDFTEIYKW